MIPAFPSHFELKEKIAEGTFGAIFIVKNKESNESLIAKIKLVDDYLGDSDEHLENEFEIYK